ncbi:hypothetical protein HXX76_014170 [Chlamydomonas incerta]|uniref:mRNA cap-binding protein n=1 Tax=Chlamydomonas incerta TaxID=51695 RepID=A0A835SHK6_CHLIN|nr:hypothetical protein HXX76_014170 [Chlamydomonas incerta]|eukprot:KAG2425012.1 hypothetical protein HXX76_014170 [Chlamydomonas incerta]
MSMMPDMMEAPPSPVSPPAVKPSHPLRDTWVVWMHSSHSQDWSLPSYKVLAVCTTAEELWSVWRATSGFLNDAMFFFMKQEYPPRWDEVQYREGGYLSLKVDSRGLGRMAEELICKAAGGTLLRADCDASPVVGVSISCKGRSSILKLWCTSPSADFRALNLHRGILDTARFTPATAKA